MGDLLIVNNVEGAVKEHETIILFKEFDSSNTNSNTIGQARVYGFNLRDAAYSGDETQFGIYIFMIFKLTQH